MNVTGAKVCGGGGGCCDCCLSTHDAVPCVPPRLWAHIATPLAAPPTAPDWPCGAELAAAVQCGTSAPTAFAVLADWPRRSELAPTVQYGTTAGPLSAPTPCACPPKLAILSRTEAMMWFKV